MFPRLFDALAHQRSPNRVVELLNSLFGQDRSPVSSDFLRGRCLAVPAGDRPVGNQTSTCYLMFSQKWDALVAFWLYAFVFQDNQRQKAGAFTAS